MLYFNVTTVLLVLKYASSSFHGCHRASYLYEEQVSSQRKQVKCTITVNQDPMVESLYYKYDSYSAVSNFLH